MKQKLLLLWIALVLQSMAICSQSITSLSGRVGNRLTINAPSSNRRDAPDLYSVQWSIFSGNKECVSLVNATSRTVAVNIIKEGKVRIQCKCNFYNSSNPGYGKYVQDSYYDITCTNSGNGGGGSGGGGFSDDNLVVPNPTVGAGWTFYNHFYYCAENTEEGIPMRFTQGHNLECYTFSWQGGAATCINRNTEGKVTIPAEVNGYKVCYIGEHSFDNCKKLTEVVIPNSVLGILQGAFAYCSSLATITIPESVKDIKWIAFEGCTSLKTITCLGKNPPDVSIYSDPFDGLQKDITLYIPQGSKEAYMANAVWKNFKEVIEIEDSFEITTSAAGYATFYSSLSAYVLPDGLKASVVTDVDESKLKLTYKELEGDVIPKGTAVMLSSTDKKSGKYTLTRTMVSSSYSDTNLLKGSDDATTTTGDGYHYKLSYGKTGSRFDSVFGWYWGDNNGGQFQIEGHKAWLVVPKTASARGFTMDENTETHK